MLTYLSKWQRVGGMVRSVAERFGLMPQSHLGPCPHLQGEKCNYIDWRVQGKSYWLCEAVKLIRMGCPLRDDEIGVVKVKEE